MKCDKVLPSAERGGISIAVYIGLITIGAAMTIETFLRRALLRRWYDLFLALPVWLGWFLAATALYFLLLYLLSLTVDKTKPVQKKSSFYRWLLNETAWLILRLGRIRIECTGLEKLQGLPPFLLVANHRSNFDPFIAIVACPRSELAYIAKPEIFDIPITGSVVHKCFFLSIDREDNRKALGTILRAAALLRDGTVSIGVYPEGTRSKTGELLPFRNGAFQIAKRAGAPIVIAKTTGTEQIAHRFARRRTIVRFDILDVLSADTVAKMTTREIGEYARAQMLQSEPATSTKKEAITV